LLFPRFDINQKEHDDVVAVLLERSVARAAASDGQS
jgi:hypothetical protein